MNASFVFDANRCTGCGACRVACTIENGLAPEVSWRRIETFNPQRRPIAPVFHLSLACNHCATAACMHACPALAYRRDAPTGAVLLESSLCIGCGYCSWACPYDAPVFDQSAGVMTKCTWCADRLRVGLKPACASHCPTGALDYGDVPVGVRMSVVDGLPATALQPSLHVIPLKPGRTQPEMTAAGPEGPACDQLPEGPACDFRANSQISLKREWPLAVFTFGSAVLVALVTASAAGAYRIAPWAFVLAAAAAMGVAGAHLGRKERAWRAILNVRRSWLSREIAVLSLFVALAAFWLLVAPANALLGWTAAFVGFSGLFCADSVYGVLPAGPGYRHSAGVATAGALLAAAFSGHIVLAVAVIALKVWLYFSRSDRSRIPPAFAATRVAAGFAAPMVIWLLAPGHLAGIACILIGEAVGRCEYYMQLARRTPRMEMDGALADVGRGFGPGTSAGLKPRPTKSG